MKYTCDVTVDGQGAIPRLIPSCGGRTNVWRTLASLVTECLQLRASNIMTGSSRVVDFASLVSVTYVICETCVVCEHVVCPAQHECGTYGATSPRR